MSKPKGKRIGTAMRGRLEEAYQTRGAAVAYLRLTYSQKSRQDVAVSGNDRFVHFLHAESDPEVKSVWYQDTRAPGPLQYTGVCAKVITLSRDLELRIIRSAESDVLLAEPERLKQCVAEFRRGIGAEYKSVKVVELTPEQLVAGNETRLRNWHRLLPAIARARQFELASHHNAVATHLASVAKTNAAEILALAKRPGEDALLFAAALRGVANGHWLSDLNEKQFGRSTVFMASERK